MQKEIKKPKRVFNLIIKRIDPKKLNYGPIKIKAVKGLPPVVDLRPGMPPVYDQGDLGSCTAQAFCGSYQYLTQFYGSRLFLYYNERKIEHTVPYDSGAYLIDGVKSLEKNGLCSDSSWPYIVNKFAIEPPKDCYVTALAHKVIKCYNVPQNLKSMKEYLNEGFPFAVGIKVYSEFESDAVEKTGIVPIPTANSKLIGGHAVLICGYNDLKKQWLFRNSWGDTWGDNGYGYLPYNHLISPSLCTELWCITLTSGISNK
jgi:C1A family cysteine protease